MKVVVWSGGADSTLVLLDALMADEEGVRALSLDTIEVKLPKNGCGSSQELGQHGLFLCHLFPYMTPGTGGKNEALFGYIRGDDFWHYRNEFESSFRWMASVACADMKIGFPLEWTRKADVLKRLDKRRVPREASAPATRRAIGRPSSESTGWRCGGCWSGTRRPTDSSGP